MLRESSKFSMERMASEEVADLLDLGPILVDMDFTKGMIKILTEIDFPMMMKLKELLKEENLKMLEK